MNKTRKRFPLAMLVMTVGLITFSTTPLKAENETTTETAAQTTEKAADTETEKTAETTEKTVETAEVYRLYSVYSGEHFYTAKKAEKEALTEAGWVYEGAGWIAPAKSNTPVYRLYNSEAGDHHYTIKAKERAALIEYGWIDEGIAFYSDDEKTMAVYRQFNPYTEAAGAHNYTISEKEKDFLISASWVDEDICWYGISEGWTEEAAAKQIAVIQKQMEAEIAAEEARVAAEKAKGVKGTDIVAAARKWIHKTRYRSGGNNPSSGVDCSGFTQYIFRQFGITINRTAKSQAANGYKVKNPQPGDLALWTHHAAIYAGNNKIVDSTSSHHGVDERVFATWRGAGTFMGFYHIPGVSNGN